MTLPTRIGLAVGAVLALVVATLAFLALTDSPEPRATVEVAEGPSELVRDDSRVLGEPGSTDVTFVEFLDFECEACRATYPVVEQLRDVYGDRVTFVLRYLPLPGHVNAERAARAVESAALQGELEAMYSLMYETQVDWGESREPADALFRTYAEQLGLDLERYDADYASPEVAARVQRDVDDALRLGVTSTPTFYVDGELVQPRTVGDLVDPLDAALERAGASG